MPKPMSNVFIQLINLVLCQAEILAQTGTELKNHSTCYGCALEWKDRDPVCCTGKANKQPYGQMGVSGRCPSSHSGMQMSQCPQVGVVLVPWVCLWSRERVGDSRGTRQSKELDCPCISNLSTDSSAGLVGKK